MKRMTLNTHPETFHQCYYMKAQHLLASTLFLIEGFDCETGDLKVLKVKDPTLFLAKCLTYLTGKDYDNEHTVNVINVL